MFRRGRLPQAIAVSSARPISTAIKAIFLFATTPAQLDFVRFPLGGLTKPETRAIARDLGLEIADKHDSQDICFVPGGRYADVIAKLRPHAAEPGEIVHLDGGVLGRHEGIIHYTIGQRRGLGVASGEPLYVVALDPARRRVIVGPRAALTVRRLVLRDVNWLGDRPIASHGDGGLDVLARVRSTRPPQPARLTMVDGSVEVELFGEETGVASGQACVFYEGAEPGARVLGGGWIARSRRTEAAEAALASLSEAEPLAAR